MWDKCVGCGEGLFAGDAFCGNCGRPTKAAAGREAPAEPREVPAARLSRAPQQAAVPAARTGDPGSGLIRIYAKPAPPTGGPVAAPVTDLDPAPRAAADSALPSEDGTLFFPATAGTAAVDAVCGGDGILPPAAGIPAGADERVADSPAGPAAGTVPPVASRPPHPPAWEPPAAGSGPAVQPAGLARTRLTGQAIFDPAGNNRFLLQVLRQGAIFAGIYAIIQTATLSCFLLLGLSGMGLGAAMGLEIISLKVVAVILVIPFWLIPVSALLGQWTVLVEGSRDTAKETFQRMSAAFSEHEVPVDSLEVRTVLPAGEDAREYLELRRGRFRGFLSCFPHGRDLYLGWTFWLRMSPARLMLLVLGRRLRHPGGGGDIDQALWAESARALVAAMHSATLAGTGDGTPAPGDPPPADAGRDVPVRVG